MLTETRLVGGRVDTFRQTDMTTALRTYKRLWSQKTPNFHQSLLMWTNFISSAVGGLVTTQRDLFHLGGRKCVIRDRNKERHTDTASTYTTRTRSRPSPGSIQPLIRQSFASIPLGAERLEHEVNHSHSSNADVTDLRGYTPNYCHGSDSDKFTLFYYAPLSGTHPF